MNQKPPITAADVPEQWILDCREAMSVHEGVPIRPNPSVPCIEVFSINRSRWMPLALPGSGILFSNFDERNIVLAKLNRK